MSYDKTYGMSVTMGYMLTLYTSIVQFLVQVFGNRPKHNGDPA